jgi:hypothetical protein
MLALRPYRQRMKQNRCFIIRPLALVGRRGAFRQGRSRFRGTLVAAMSALLAMAGCSPGISSMKGIEAAGVSGRAGNAVGTCVTLATPSPAPPAPLPAGSQVCVKRVLGKVGSCVTFTPSDGPIGARPSRRALLVNRRTGATIRSGSTKQRLRNDPGMLWR